jgi:hypothetical protein
VHRLSPPSVRLAGDRAIAEASAGIEACTVVEGTEADLVSYARLLYQAERTDVGWRIRSLHCIDERDMITTAVPGITLVIDASELAAVRPSYRCLAWLLTRRRYEVASDLPGDDRPELVEASYSSAFRWLAGT